MSFQQITIQATIHTALAKVWDYYTQAEHVIHWNFASADWHCPTATTDLQVGGKFSSRMEAKDGSFGFDFEGIYTKVLPHQSFTYQLGDKRQVTVQFQSVGDTTEVRIDFDAETENPIDMQQAGWQAILNNFKQYVESN
jgi:uncharacterized protein YndB with AHSA1/START domain